MQVVDGSSQLYAAAPDCIKVITLLTVDGIVLFPKSS